jgi:hypothetical protein
VGGRHGDATMMSAKATKSSGCRLLSVASIMVVLAGCATWREPPDPGDAALRERAISRTSQGVRLDATVLGPEDSIRMFGADVVATGVQPVWIEVQNASADVLWLLRSGTDPDYFSPHEVAWSVHAFLGGKTNDRIDEHFDRLSFANPIPPGQTRSGVLFTNPQPAPKVLNVDLLGNQAMVPFTLFLPVPGYPDVSTVESLHPYPESAVTDHDDLESFRAALQQLPCCAVRASDGGPAEPLNAVFVGSYENIASAAARRGYRRVQADEGVDQLVFGRPPDAVAHKRAQAGAPANWVRLWSAPIRLQGQPVFVVQVGRPVGGRFVAEASGARHLHPDVDEARNLFVQDMMYSGGLERLGFVTGVGAVPRAQPRLASSDASYFTDGLRAVFFFATRPLTISDVRLLDWEPLLDEREPKGPQERARAIQD